MPHDARALANLVLDLADEYRISIDALSLQKILYFAHGWWLASKGQPLCAQAFEAWDYGPVVRIVYQNFKNPGSRAPIMTRATARDPFTGDLAKLSSSFSDDEVQFLSRCVNHYGRYPASTLVELTHEPGGAWDEAVKRGNLGKLIPNGLIADDFRQKLRKNN